jgi:CubicO group peptidase (beta-lactamase class C family)
MKRKALFALSGALCLAMTAPAYPAQGANDSLNAFEKQMDEFIAGQLTGNNGVGLSIVVVENNRIIYQKGFGFANKKDSIRVGPSTLFHIGSITKLFTGISIMQLVEKKLIDLDAPIQQYLPEFSIKYHDVPKQAITIRSIMAHQSGIFGDKMCHEEDTVYPMDDFRTFPQFAKGQYAAYHPNYITAYSNFAVAMLGAIIERVSGQKYEDYVRDNILKPCSMTETGFDPKKDNDSLLARPYDQNGNAVPYIYINGNPAGFLATNSNNMVNFMKMIMNDGCFQENRILNSQTLNSMFVSQSDSLPMKLHTPYAVNSFGLSWVLENENFDYLGKVVGHSGGINTYLSQILIAKDKNIGVFATSNTGFYPGDIAYFALMQAGKIFRNAIKPNLPEVPPVVTMPNEAKKIFTGTYCILGYNPIEIFFQNDTLFWQRPETQRISLVYHADDWASFTDHDTIVKEVRVAVRIMDGRKVLCTEQRSGIMMQREIAGCSFTPLDPVSDNIRHKTGLYTELSSNSDAFKVVLDTLPQSKAWFLSALRLDYNIPYVLNMAKDTTIIIQGLGRSANETAFFTGDTVNFSGYKFLKTAELPQPSAMAKMKDAEAPTLISAAEFLSDLKKRLKSSLEIR